MLHLMLFMNICMLHLVLFIHAVSKVVLYIFQIDGAHELNEESLSLFTLLEPKLGEFCSGMKM